MRNKPWGGPPRLTDDRRGCGMIPPSDPPLDGQPTFAIVRKGYDPTQVDQHLAWLAAAPPPGEDDAYLEADRILADARRLAAEICLEASQRLRDAEAAARRAQSAADQAEAELDAARAEAARLLAEARETAENRSALHEVA